MPFFGAGGNTILTTVFFFFFKEERIQISLKAGHHRPASETPLNGVSLACRWWPNVECWLGSFENSWGSGPVLLRNSIFLWFFGGGGGGGGGGGWSGPPVPPLDPRMGPDNVYTYWDILKTHFIVRIGFCTHFAYFLSHAKFFKFTKHSFLNSIRVWSGSKTFLQM